MSLVTKTASGMSNKARDDILAKLQQLDEDLDVHDKFVKLEFAIVKSKLGLGKKARYEDFMENNYGITFIMNPNIIFTYINLRFC